MKNYLNEIANTNTLFSIINELNNQETYTSFSINYNRDISTGHIIKIVVGCYSLGEPEPHKVFYLRDFTCTTNDRFIPDIDSDMSRQYQKIMCNIFSNDYELDLKQVRKSNFEK